jgi:hypothetical protein
MMLAIRTEDPVKACHLYRVAKRDREADYFWVSLVSARERDGTVQKALSRD